MKRLMLVCVIILWVFLVTACASISRDVIIPTSASFDMETDGLVQVQTVHESDKTVKNYVLASGIRIMDTEAFIPDDMHVYTVRSFSTGMDNMLEGPLRVYDEANRIVPVTREIDIICHAMLNVNLWIPSQDSHSVRCCIECLTVTVNQSLIWMMMRRQCFNRCSIFARLMRSNTSPAHLKLARYWFFAFPLLIRRRTARRNGRSSDCPIHLKAPHSCKPSHSCKSSMEN